MHSASALVLEWILGFLCLFLAPAQLCRRRPRGVEKGPENQPFQSLKNCEKLPDRASKPRPACF